MKESYRIGKILKKLTGLKFVKVKQISDISSRGKEKADTYYESRKRIKTVRPSPKQEKKDNNQYIQYQKEVQAQRLMGKTPEAKAPGKILKLPVDRKELMIKLEEEP